MRPGTLSRLALLVVLVPSLSFTVHAADPGISLSLAQGMEGRSARAVFSSGTVNMSCTLSVEKGSDYVFRSSPVFTVDGGRWFMGEVRPAGLLRLLTDPSDVGYEEIGRASFQHAGSPSDSPDLTGAGISAGSFDFVALSSSLHAESPDGLGFVFDTPYLYGGLLCAKANVGLDDAILQTRWDSSPGGRAMVFALVGNESVIRNGEKAFRSTAFLQCGWDRLLGGGATVGVMVDAENGPRRISATAKSGGKGVRLVGTKAADRARFSFSLEMEVEGKACFGTEVEIGGDPLYGGTTRWSARSVCVSAIFGKLLFKTSSTLEDDGDGHRSATSSMRLDYNGHFDVEAGITLNRKNGSASFGKVELGLGFDRGSIEATISKGEVAFSMTLRTDGMTFRNGCRANQQLIF